MKLNKLYILQLMKIFFSAIFAELLYASLCLWAHTEGVRYAGVFVSVFRIPEILEYCSASAALTLAGGFVLMFCDEISERFF